MASSNALPELAETDAPAEITAIYGAIKERSGVPMVALIWRHLATLPGVLPEAWAAIEPLFQSGALQEAAWTASEKGVDAPPSQLDRSALQRAGLDANQLAAYIRVLEAYNRANPVNFVGVNLLLHGMRKGSDVRAMPLPPSRLWSPPPAIGALPKMAPLSAFSADQRRMVDAMASSSPSDRAGVVPSLYRHLIDMPGLIPAIHTDLIGRFQSGEIKETVQSVSRTMQHEVEKLSGSIPALGKLALVDGVSSVLTRFTSIIPEMVTVGLLLRRGIDHKVA